MEIWWTVLLFIFGAVLGSFACCQVWRIRKHDKSKFSHCMHCKYQLQWYDNIPIISWLSLAGKCRKCKKPIGCAEILAEVGLALVFALSYIFWPVKEMNTIEIVKFGLFLVLFTIFTILFIYDAKWFELPVKLMVAAVVIAGVYRILNIWPDFVGFDWLSLIGCLVVMPGFYYLMYKISHETWVGGGDWILCISLALMLGNFWLGVMCVFISNLIGSFVCVPIAISKKNKKMKIPFGPFLIIGFWLVFLAQNLIMSMIVI